MSGPRDTTRPPDLETARLELRPVRESDLGTLHRQWSSPEVHEYLFDGQAPSPELVGTILAAVIASARDTGVTLWLAIERATGRPLGVAGLRVIDDDLTPASAPPGTVELLYALEPAAWGRGFAAEASRAVLEHARVGLGLERVVARTDGPNLRSLRVMQRLGLVLVERAPTGAFGETVVTERRWV